MGTVYKETFTKPIPAGARIIVRKGQRFAEWKPTKGKTRTAPLTAAGDRITVESGTYTAKYRDGSGIVRKVSTGCRDEAAARSMLTELEKRADKVRSGMRSEAEDAVLDHQGAPLAEHVAAFIEHQQARGVTPKQIDNVRGRVNRVSTDCGWKRLADLAGVHLERWLSGRQAEGMGAVTRNAHREAWVTFGNWCVKNHRLLSNPFAGVPKADIKADVRRKRRALTEDELVRLLDVARRRPIEDARTIRRGKRQGEVVAQLREETRRRLERLGQERALIYKTLVLTGLRKGELASLTVGQVVLDADPPHLVLDAADEKNREGSTIPLRSDLAADIRDWLVDKAAALQEASQGARSVRFDPKAIQGKKRNQGDSTEPKGYSFLPLPTVPSLPADTPLFDVPAGLVRILDRDLVAAGIARRVEVVPGKWRIDKRDDRGRTVDVHALRHTFGTLLSKGGVAPRTAQAAMRHSTIDLTMNVYTDPRLLDVVGAMDALPSLPLGAGPQTEAAALSATGTDDLPSSPLVPVLVPTAGQARVLQSTADQKSTIGCKGRRKSVARGGDRRAVRKRSALSRSWLRIVTDSCVVTTTPSPRNEEQKECSATWRNGLRFDVKF